MKKKIVSVILILLISLMMILSSCSPEFKIIVGKYYYDNDKDAYINILSNEKLEFHNVNFSEIQAELDQLEIECDISKRLQGVQKYSVNENFNRMFIDLVGSMVLTLKYSSETNTISINNQEFKIGLDEI